MLITSFIISLVPAKMDESGRKVVQHAFKKTKVETKTENNTVDGDTYRLNTTVYRIQIRTLNANLF